VIPPLPLSQAFLEQYRIRAKRYFRPSLVGGHTIRRKGQSLEFRDFAPYLPGDDIRYIDWRASARYYSLNPMDMGWLVRRFTAEENQTLTISVDNRETMRLPDVMPKLHVAIWLAEALARVALQSDDRVFLHHLFGRNHVLMLEGKAAMRRAASILERFREVPDAREQANLAALEQARCLPPTAVWIIITDFYFEQGPAIRPLLHQIMRVQEGLRWVIMVDLNSWPYEKAQLGYGGRQIEGPGQFLPPETARYEIDERALSQVEEKIEGHKNAFHSEVQRGGYTVSSHWNWPAVSTDPLDFFRNSFSADRVLERLFMKEV
jgi:hypothetical protein